MAQKTTKNQFIMTTAQICQLFGHSPSAFRKRTLAADFPEDCKISYGRWDLKVYLRWVMGRFKIDEKKMNLAETKLAREQKKLEKETIEVDVLKKEYLPIEQVKQDLSFVLIGLKQRFLAWSKTLPPHLIDKDEKELSLVIRTETRALLQDLSQGIKALVPKEQKAKRKGKRK